MVIVAGKIYIKSSQRAKFLELSMEAVVLARQARGCLDYVVAADPLEETRVNVFEMWATENDLLSFRGGGPSEDMFSLIERAEVSRHTVAKSGPA